MSCVSLRTIRDFLIGAFTARAMPIPAALPDPEQAFVRVKFENVYVLEGRFSIFTYARVFAEPWAKATALFGQASQMRMIAHGKQMNPDYAIESYARTDHTGRLTLKIHLVLQLQGGGASKSPTDAITKQKNEIAKHLLDQGAGIDEIQPFIEKLLTTAGQPALSACMKPRDGATRTSNLQKLAKTLSISLPSMKNVADSSRKVVQKKLDHAQAKQATIRAEDFQPQAGYFRNEDDTHCQCITAIKQGATGVAICNPADALPWIRSEMTISQDELALLVLGECPAPSDRCQKMQIPAVAADEKPVILAVCCHQLGAKQVTTQAHEDSKIQVGKTSVLAFSVYKDEVEPDRWAQIVNSPVKAVLELVRAQGLELSPTASPWGRSWRNDMIKATPETANSLQVYARVPESQAKDCLKLSGQKSVYVTLKTEDRRTDLTHAVLWMDLPLPELRVAAASHKSNLGIIRITKGSKTSRGIRFHTDDFEEAQKQLKPSATPSSHVTIKAVARMSPTPLGADYEAIKNWIAERKWKAKPIESLGPQTWLIGFEQKITDQWVSWGGQLMLITWEEPRVHKQVKPLVAGQTQVVKAKAMTQDMPEDPWAAWHRKHGTSPAQVPAASAPSAPRIVEGPIEQRFQKQDEQIAGMKESVRQLTERLETNEKSQNTFQTAVKSQLESSKQEMQTQLADMHSQFDISLEKAMRKQDTQMERGFAELRQLILNKPTPAKKAKLAKPAESAAPGDDENDDDDM
eukprot:s3888_g5.t1